MFGGTSTRAYTRAHRRPRRHARAPRRVAETIFHVPSKQGAPYFRHCPNFDKYTENFDVAISRRKVGTCRCQQCARTTRTGDAWASGRRVIVGRPRACARWKDEQSVWGASVRIRRRRRAGETGEKIMCYVYRRPRIKESEKQ